MARVNRSDFATEAEYKAAYMRARYQEDIQWVRAYKVEKGCADCGYNAHHAGLQFDHLTPRNGNVKLTVSRLMSKGLNRVKQEIGKCDVVCSTCHSIRTWNRLQEQAPVGQLVSPEDS